MNKKNSAIILLATLFPQVALAHFQENHAPIWQEPMHYLLQHDQGAFIAAILVVGVIVYFLKKVSNK